MTMPPRPPGSSDAETHARDEGYVSSLAVRPHSLTPPGRQPSRLRELSAVVAWILASWLRSGDAGAAWEQRAGCEHREP